MRLTGQRGAGHIAIPDLTLEQPGPATIEAWVWANRADVPKAIFVAGGRARIELAIAPDHRFAWDDTREDGDIGSRESSPVAHQSWVHLAYVTDGPPYRLYVDGKEAVSAREAPSNLRDKASVDGGWIGGHTLDNNPTKIGCFFAGRIDEARVSRCVRYDKNFIPENRWKSDAQTLALYHFDEATGDVLNDSSGNGRYGRIVHAKWVPR